MMKKLAIPLSLALVGTLAACGGLRNTLNTPVSQASETRVVGSVQATYVASATAVPIGGVLRAGAGRITYLNDPTGPIANSSAQRVTMKMGDNSLQVLDVTGVQLEMGEVIRVNSDGSIRRHL